jgi:hypothetical protein
MLHRLPDKPELSPDGDQRPSKYIILITASTAVAGKVQIAKSVSAALSCSLFQGDSLHETSAKAASVGAPSRTRGTDGDEQVAASGANEARYERMWLSKMTRTGYLFPEASRPATDVFAGFGGASSSTSRRGSGSSIASASSLSDASGSTSSITGSSVFSIAPTIKYVNKPPVVSLSEEEKLRNSNPALMVVTHPRLEQWHKDSIRKAVREYGIGIIFVPLDKDEELPVLKPLDPRAMTRFPSLGAFGAVRRAAGSTLDEEILLGVDVEARVEDLIDEVVEGVRDTMAI